jgi:hypothetical protein
MSNYGTGNYGGGLYGFTAAVLPQMIRMIQVPYRQFKRLSTRR